MKVIIIETAKTIQDKIGDIGSVGSSRTRFDNRKALIAVCSKRPKKYAERWLDPRIKQALKFELGSRNQKGHTVPRDSVEEARNNGYVFFMEIK